MIIDTLERAELAMVLGTEFAEVLNSKDFSGYNGSQVRSSLHTVNGINSV